MKTLMFPLAVCSALLSWGAAVQGAEAAPPIESSAELAAFVVQHPEGTPLDAFSAGGRERFVMSLRFGDRGLSGFSGGDLAAELTQEEIRAVLGLFGPDATKYAPKSMLTVSAQRARGNAADRAHMSSIDRAYNEFLRRNREAGEDRSKRFDQLLAANYTTERLRGAEDGDLRLLWWGIQEVAPRSLERRHIDAFQRTFLERKRRNPTDLSGVKAMQALLLAARRFEEASALAGQYPDAKLQPLPEFRNDIDRGRGVATAWSLAADGKVMTRKAFDLKGMRIIVTASCHFSKDAAADIAADPVLSPIFEQYAQWMTEPPGREDIDAARKWNAEFPRAPVVMAYDQNEWPMLPSWATPNFYVMRDGRVIERIEGWSRDPAKGSRPLLIDALRRSGLLNP